MTPRSDDAAFFSVDQARPQRFRIENHTTVYFTDLARGGDGVQAETLELSLREVVFRTREPLQQGSEVRLQLQVPFKRLHVRAVGRIDSCQPEEHGSFRVTASYSKLLSGSDEALFDTLLRFLAP